MHFQAVVMQGRERIVQEKCDARANLLFCLISLLLFLFTSRCRRRRRCLSSLFQFVSSVARGIAGADQNCRLQVIVKDGGRFVVFGILIRWQRSASVKRRLRTRIKMQTVCKMQTAD